MYPPDILTWINWPGIRPVVGEAAIHVREVWIEDVYRCHSIDFQDRAVVDLGAATGDFSLFAAQRGARVLAIEPQEDAFKQLCENSLHAELDTLIWPVNVAVARTSGTGLMKRSGQSAAFLPYDSGGKIPCLPLEHVLDMAFPNEDIAFLKCDIEGSEWEVFPDAPFKRVEKLAIEWHGTDKEYWQPGVLGALLEHLSNTHAFSCVGSPHTMGGYIYANRFDI